MLTALCVIRKIADNNARTAYLYVALAVLKCAGNLLIGGYALLRIGLYEQWIFLNKSIKRESNN